MPTGRPIELLREEVKEKLSPTVDGSDAGNHLNELQTSHSYHNTSLNEVHEEENA